MIDIISISINCMKEVQRRLTEIKNRCSNNIDSGKCKQTKYLLRKAENPDINLLLGIYSYSISDINQLESLSSSNDDIWEITIIWPLQTVQ